MSEQRSKKRIAVIIILAFVLPILVLLAVMAICGVIPFGSKSTLVWDSLLQHKDYYGYLWDVFHGKASIEYSAGKSLGGRMIGLIGFYISSPLNIFLVFFSKAHIPYFMVFMIILRIGLCGITGYIYIFITDSVYRQSLLWFYPRFMHLWNTMCIIVGMLCGLMGL